MELDTTGRWFGILKNLGVDEKFLRNKHGPCPVCIGKDRFRFDDKDGRGTWFCSHCGAGDGFGLLKLIFGWDFKQALTEVNRMVGVIPAQQQFQERSEENKIKALTDVWKSARQVKEGDPVWLYLNRRTGIETVPPDIRYHPELIYTEDKKYIGNFPAMVSLMRYPSGEGVTIHRTYLTMDGKKADLPSPKKIMPGKPLKTSAVRLGEPNDCLGIAEGIETALAASIIFDLPVWAATTAVVLETWVPPDEIKRIWIYGDSDESFTGQAAAYSLAKRLKNDGLTVEVLLPAIGEDWANVTERK